MDRITRKHLTAARAAVESAISGIDLPGMALALGKGKYGDYGEITITISAVAADGTVETKEAMAFRTYAEMEGLKPEWLGRSFMDAQGVTHVIKGFRPRATKRPILTDSTAVGGRVWPVAAILRYASQLDG